MIEVECVVSDIQDTSVKLDAPDGRLSLEGLLLRVEQPDAPVDRRGQLRLDRPV